ncbi:hybrid sensor histidine kinase/response regulator [Beggiatoa leptomitoformis]|uniref:histidine kinase n=1 Tax=Beggiatoa leptomitoformis TaxID=288004 RepID=A0A2N9YA71_9GAMM|nr:hybrid sensor histidine kinase/response regulator [Beggiatoa leptomitoformis]ALG67235.1 response regulator [Beggiatoa leptomitoformis]AUI67347.1 response regulator [Beggiatoa leptomitoformis]
MNTTSTKKTVLVIDDTPDNVRLLLKLLTEANLKVLVARDGREGLARTEYIQPDLILLDMMMPNMNGFETCQALKEKEKTRHIPIIFMTAIADVASKVKGFELGAVDYITKPFQNAEVLARVNTQLQIHHLQNILRKQAAVLEERNRDLEAFSRMVAHNLKGPLSSLINVLDIVAEEIHANTNSCEKIRWSIQVGWDMNQCIESLLLLARAGGNEVNPNLEPLDMVGIINTIIKQRLEYTIKKKKAVIHIPQELPIAQGNSLWVLEIWSNYLSNALKYGGIPPELTIGADEQTDKMIRFWVKDNGHGLNTEQQSKLFIPFSRLQNHAEGYGLGLSIVRQIVEKLGGQVGIESRAGQGSLFYFTLPAYPLD